VDIYENIIIGNFLYGAGIAMGRSAHAEGVPLSVNLLQQTPLDHGAADVLVRGSRAMRLLEFKRFRNDNIKEASKLLLLQRALSVPVINHLEDLSREVHWYLESESSSSVLNLRIVPYLDFNNRALPGPSLQQFIEEMVAEAISVGQDRSELYSEYLDVVARCQGAPKGGSGALIVSVDGGGHLNYAVVEDLRELGLSLSRYHQLNQDRQISLQPEQELQRHNVRGRGSPELGGQSL